VRGKGGREGVEVVWGGGKRGSVVESRRVKRWRGGAGGGGATRGVGGTGEGWRLIGGGSWFIRARVRVEKGGEGSRWWGGEGTGGEGGRRWMGGRVVCRRGE